MEFPRIHSLSELIDEGPHWVDYLLDPPVRCPTLKPSRKRELGSDTTKNNPFSMDDRGVFSFYFFMLTSEEVWGKMILNNNNLQQICEDILGDLSHALKIVDGTNGISLLEHRDSLLKILIITITCLTKGEGSISSSKKTEQQIWFSFKSKSLALLSSLFSIFINPLPSQGGFSSTDTIYLTQTLFETFVSLLLMRWNLVAPPQCRPYVKEISSSIAGAMTLPFLIEKIDGDPNEPTRHRVRSNCLSFCEDILFKSLDYVPSFLALVMKQILNSPNRNYGMCFLNKVCSPKTFYLGNVALFIEHCCKEFPSKMIVFLPSLLKLKSDGKVPIRRKLFQCHLFLLEFIPPTCCMALLHVWGKGLALDTDAMIRTLLIKIITLQWLFFFGSKIKVSFFNKIDFEKALIYSGTLLRLELLEWWYLLSAFSPVSLISQKLTDANEKVRIAAVTGLHTLLCINHFGPNLIEEQQTSEQQTKVFHLELRSQVLEAFKIVYSLLSCTGLDHSHTFLEVVQSFLCGDSPPEIAKWLAHIGPPPEEKIISFLKSKPRPILKLNWRSLVVGAHCQKNANIVGKILSLTYLNEQNDLGMSLVWIPLINRLDKFQFSNLRRIFNFFLVDLEQRVHLVRLDRMIPFYFEILANPSECLRFPILANESTTDILLGTCNLLSLLAPLFPSAMVSGIQRVLIPIISELRSSPNDRKALVKPMLGIISSTVRYTSPKEITKLRDELIAIFSDNFRILVETDSRSFVNCVSELEDGPVKIQGFLHELEDELRSFEGDPDYFAVRFTAFVQMIGLCALLKGKIIASWTKEESEGQSDSENDYMSDYLKKSKRESEFHCLCNEFIYGSLGRFVPMLEDFAKMDCQGDLAWFEALRVSSLQALGVMSSWCTQLTKRVSPLLYHLSSYVRESTSSECQQTAVVALCDLLNRDGVSDASSKIMSTLVEITKNPECAPKLRVRALSLLAASLLGNLVPFENYLHHLTYFVSDSSESVASCSREALIIIFRQRVKDPAVQAKTIFRIIHSIHNLPGDSTRKETSLGFLFSELLPSSQHGTLSVLLLQSIKMKPSDELLSISLSKIRPSPLSLQKLQNALDEISENLSENTFLRDRILEHLDNTRATSESKQLVCTLQEILQKRKRTVAKKKTKQSSLPCVSDDFGLMDIQEVCLELE